jgi:hypothetical protein
MRFIVRACELIGRDQRQFATDKSSGKLGLHALQFSRQKVVGDQERSHGGAWIAAARLYDFLNFLGRCHLTAPKIVLVMFL